MKAIQIIVFIFWFSLVMGLIVLAALLSTMTFEPETASAASDNTDIFAFIAGVNAALTFGLRWLLLGGFRTGKRSLARPAGLACYVIGHLLVFALSEGVGVLGFVNGITANGKMNAWLPLMAGGLILLLIHIPLPVRFRVRNGGLPAPAA